MSIMKSLAFILLYVSTSAAFYVAIPTKISSSNTALNMNSDRRKVISQGVAAAVGLVMSRPDRASASYSAYAAREKDWDQRSKKGEIDVRSAKDLRASLREIAPMNSAGSKIFCPNGESSAVSPMMENKCGDRLATPSVYGRIDDSVGNSIPGFKGGLYSGNTVSSGQTKLSSNPTVGGFPKY